MIEVRISEGKRVGTGQRYVVSILEDGLWEPIIEEARDPEFEAARWLASRGYTGRMKTRSFVLDIQRAAKLSTSDGKAGLSFRKYQPWSWT